MFYLLHEPDTAKEVTTNLERIESTIPVMLDLAENELQRGALAPSRRAPSPGGRASSNCRRIS